jgi:arylsulfatase A-like enzyme
MPPRPLASLGTVWASAYVGCVLLLFTGLQSASSVSIELLGQVCWLALIGSIPTSLILGASARVARSPTVATVTSAAAVALLAAAVAWGHTDFLLSGPRWALHPRRDVARAAMVCANGLLATGGWAWLIAGARLDRSHRRGRVAWTTLTVVAVALLMATIGRYRAYDHSIAQLVLPAGVLSSAVVYLVLRESRHQAVLIGVAAVGLLCGAGSRLDPSLVATGQREVTAHNRPAALATLYLIPRFGHEEAWTIAGKPCPEPRPATEQSSIDIGPAQRRNVIIITVDALRKDVVGAQANGRLVAPELTRLANRGVSFTNATSTYPATLFAVGSAFTGLSPAELYVAPALPDTIFTRSRAVVDQQFVVLPDVRWFHLPIVGELLAPDVETAFAPNDAATTDATISRLRAARETNASVMAWVHYYAPHDPYRPHPEHRFGGGKKNAYLSEVAHFDEELGRLMRYLNDDGWLDDTLVVFFSDHGEALGEKSYWGHHVYLNGWMLDVPLVLWHADLAPSAPIVGVSIADVAPTVLHFLGLPIPQDTAAASLFTLDPDQRSRPTFSEAFPVRGEALFHTFRLPALDDASIRARLRSIRRASKGYEPKGAMSEGRYRLVHHRGANTMLLYDHDTDPAEQRDVGASQPDTLARLQRGLELWEQQQLRRIRCRLQLTEDRPATPRPE